jgi:DNA repair exonuclease SbcCD ATPase subunit
LFRLPLAEFTGARNALAAQLKKNGLGDEAADVKARGKPTVSAWAVNQLYWNHREAFDKLIASGERFHKAQSSRSGAKVADMRNALDARREALTKLSDIAARVLRDAGHNPSPDTIHRITTTLEGISAYASRDDGPRLGRLTHDVDPPGFESFGSAVPIKQDAVGRRQTAGAGGRSRRQEAGAGGRSRRQDAGSTQRPDADKRKVEEASEKIAAATVGLKEAKRSLTEAQARVRSLEAAKTRARAEVRQAEERVKEVVKRARSVEEDLKDAGREVADAERRVEEATGELESL